MLKSQIILLFGAVLTFTTTLLISILAFYVKKLDMIIGNITKIELYQTENITRIYEILKSHSEQIDKLQR